MPILVGIVKLDIPLFRPKKSAAQPPEQIKHVAFDEEGNAWGLVTRIVDLGDGLSRIDHVRWVPFHAIPFVEQGESVEPGPGGWKKDDA